jgi:catechol 2,3-dioxygenase-like lactoylglutathione lyase family enzyme
MSPSPKPIAPNPRPIDAGVSIGHVHLKVADLNRAIAFYCGVLGFDLMQRYGHEAAFLSAGDYHQAKVAHPLHRIPRGYTMLLSAILRGQHWRTHCEG